MESIRPSSSGYFPEVSDDLGREPGSPYPSQESLPADSYSDTPGSVDQLSQSHQETYLRAAHYTVVHARPGELVQHVQEGDKDGEPAFCVQAVGSYTDGGGELDKGVPHELQFISPDLSGAAYQLSASGEVYKLVVRETKPGEEVSEEQLAAHYSHQLLPDPLHQEAEPAAEPAVDHPTELQTVEKKLVLPLPPPPPSQTPSQPLPQSQSSQPPPPPPRTPHCLICDVPLTNHTVLDIFSNSTHQTSTTYAIKLRQITGHRASLAFHSEVLCESCASLLNVVDSFEARLREIQARLDDTRAEVRTKFGRTSARYDETLVPGPEVLDLDTGAVRSKKRRSGEEAKPTKKKARSKAALAVKDAAYKNKSKTNASDEGAAPKRPRPTRRAVERRRALTEAEGADPEEGADDLDDPSGPNYMEPGDNRGDQSPDDAEVAAADAGGGDGSGDDGDSPQRRRRVLNRCPHCHVIQDSVPAFRAHLASHPELSPDTAAEHLTQKTTERLTYACSRCPATFASYREQQRHVRGRHPSFTRCPACLTQVEKVPGLLAQHLASHSAPVRCSFCSLQADTVTELCRHTEQHHPLALDSLYCELCRAFVDEAAFAGHLRTEHPTVPELCVQCRKCGEVVRRSALAGHMRVHEESHRCRYCSRSFPSASLLMVHERTHTGERPFWCEECRKSYISKATLDAHVSAFHRVHQYACGECPRSFKCASNLKRHQLTHRDTKPFVCQVCQKGFVLENHLNLHVRAIHLGETPHECHICHKAFPYKSSLKDHLHVHTGDKSFCCLTCGKRFGTAKTLRSHSFTHRKEKPYKCDFNQCSANFSRKDLLARHKLGRHGIAPEVKYSRLQGRPAAPPPPQPAPVQYVMPFQTPRPAPPPQRQ